MRTQSTGTSRAVRLLVLARGRSFDEIAKPRGPRTAGSISGWKVALAAVLAAAGVAIVIVLSVNGGTGAPRTVVQRSQHRASPTAVRPLLRLVLLPAGPDRGAFGAGAVVRQKGALLLLQARGLRPNHNDSYAVWLFTTPVDSRLLGLASTGVGSDGTFSSGTSLPDDAIRFHALTVTRETSSEPTHLGQIVLRAPLSLPQSA